MALSSNPQTTNSLCSVCRSTSRRLFQKYGYWIQECETCTHRSAEIDLDLNHVKQVYADSYFAGDSAGYPNYLKEQELLVAHGKRYGKLLSQHMTPGTVLDVGAAAGFLLKGLSHSGWQGWGVEPNPNMVAFANQELDLPVAVGTLEDYQTDRRFKLISMIQVIAHFYDLQRALSVAAELTEPGGYWLIESWNKDSLVARLFGQSWHEYSPPSVLHWFSPTSMEELVQQYGFRQVARGRPQKWLDGAHAKSLFQHKMGTSFLGRTAGQLSNLIPDKLPIPYPNYDLFWGLYQKSTP
jgi:2-polyprenyl-3-methyl-5-hydroxy-6-metoxy-1,4-benzoquinol methylase